MYLDISTLVAIGIALVSAILVMVFTITENITLQSQIKWLRNRNQELTKKISNMVEVPF